MQFTLESTVLALSGPGFHRRLDLAAAIRVRLYNRPEKRYFELNEFEVGMIVSHDKMIRCNLRNDRYGLIIPLIFAWNDTELEVTAESGLAVETLGSSWRLMEIAVLPDLITAAPGADGFFLLPAYSGTLVRLDRNHEVRNRDRFYLDQSEWEKFGLLNCFAAAVDGTGILAIADEGDFHAWCDTELHRDAPARIYATFGIRHHFSEVLPQERKKMIYRFFPACSDYARMALSYREYLMRRHRLVPLRERAAANPVLQYATEAMRVKIFMGHKKPYMADGSSPLTVCTTFAEAGEMLEAMRAAGIAKAIVTLVGWNSGGHDGAYPSRFPVEERFGGEAGLRRLIDRALALGYQIVPHDNVTDVYLNAPAFDFEYVSRDEGEEPQPAGLWAGGQSYKTCPTVYLDRYGGDFRRIHGLGFRGVYYLDAQSTGLFRCTDRRHPADERQFALSLARILTYPRELYGAVSCECAPAYALPFFDEAARIHGQAEFEMFKSRLPDPFRAIAERVVPFYQIAVHGLILYQDQWVHSYRRRRGVRHGMLHELATGARPAMEIAANNEGNGDLYTDSIRDIAEAYRVAFELVPDLHRALIADYRELSPEVCRIAYDNDCEVAVNLGTTELDAIPSESVIIRRHGQVVYDSNQSINPKRNG